MTHNFDFFRIINSRFVGYPNCLMATKSPVEIKLAQAEGIQNVFQNDWKLHFFDDRKKKIGSIPFLRNLIEFTTGSEDPKFIRLTSLLHWKPDSGGITVADLDGVYNQVCGRSGVSANGAELVIDMIHAEAILCMGAGVGINFVNKIVLSIAIRLTAEKFMVDKIADARFWSGILKNQTYTLVSKFKQSFPGDINSAQVLDGVLLMTTENIHLNSFMYEPILDMSDDHLRKLYAKVLALK
jgi:hypothetical protein